MWVVVVVATVAATLALSGAPAQAAWTQHQPILSWPGNTKIGDRWIVYFDRNETGAIAGGGVGAATRQLQRTGMNGILVWALAGTAASLAHHAVSQSGKCLTVKGELFWGWLPNVSVWLRNC